MAQHYTVTTIRDKSNEKSAFKLYNGAITGASIAGFLTEYGNLKTEMAKVVIGVIAEDMWVGDKTEISAALPASYFAQRELKILLTYQGDTSQKLYTATLPCPDLAKWLPGERDICPISAPAAHADVISFIAAVEQLGRTPDDDTETITVLSARFVGRNI